MARRRMRRGVRADAVVAGGDGGGADPKFKNIELCNGVDRTSLDAQIERLHGAHRGGPSGRGQAAAPSGRLQQSG